MNQELFIKCKGLPSEHSNNTACERQKVCFLWTTGLDVGKPFGVYKGLLKINTKIIALTVLHCLVQNILNLLKMIRLFN